MKAKMTLCQCEVFKIYTEDVSYTICIGGPLDMRFFDHMGSSCQFHRWNHGTQFDQPYTHTDKCHAFPFEMEIPEKYLGKFK